MELKDDLVTYEQDLVQALLDQSYRRQTESPDDIQVFVSHQSVGTLECDSKEMAEKVFQTDLSPELIELRSSTGLPVGTLIYDPQNPKPAQYQAGHYLIELDVQPQDNKSLVSVRVRNLLSITQKSPDHATSQDEHHIVKQETSLWSMVALAAQLILVAGVVFLVTDRLFSRTNPQNNQGQLVASQEEQLQQVLQQLAVLQSRLTQPDALSVADTQETAQQQPNMTVMTRAGPEQPTTDSLLTKKADVFEQGLLESRPVWVRFKKGVKPEGIATFFKDVSAQDRTQLGGWYSFNLGIPKSETPDKILTPLSKRGDIEIITTSVVTRRVQVRFKKDVADDEINGFFEEIRVKRQKPKDNWYNLNLSLPEPIQPESFISELRSGGIVDKINVNLDELPAM